MGETTAIEWTATYHADGTKTPGRTWNPWQGCKKVSPGCKFCYMYRDKTRYGQDPMTVVRSSPATFNAPLKWREPAKVFTCSWSDWFIDEADGWRDEAWDIVRRTPRLTYQILTKRPERILDHLPADWGNGWPNVWLGTSAENQQYADERIPHLLRVPAVVRFLSAEPLLGPVNLTKVGPERWDVLHGWKPANENYPEGANTSRVDWVIVGGESGPGARPMHPDWARNLRDQCQAAGVPFFFKQNGEWVPAEHPVMKREPILSYYDSDYKRGIFDGNGTWKFHEGTYSKYENILGQVMYRVGKKAAGRLLDGVEWNEMPRLKEAA